MSQNIALGAAVVLGIYTLIMIVRKFVEYSTAASATRSWVSAIKDVFEKNVIDEDVIRQALDVSEKYKASHLARVVAAGLAEVQSEKRAHSAPAEITTRAERAMNSSLELVKHEFKLGTAIMKVTAGIAPILAAYQSTRAAIITGIAIVAPAIWMSIYAENKVNAFSSEIKLNIGQMLNYLERGLKASKKAPAKS